MPTPYEQFQATRAARLDAIRAGDRPTGDEATDAEVAAAWQAFLNVEQARAHERSGKAALAAGDPRGADMLAAAAQLYHLAGRDDDANRAAADGADCAKAAGLPDEMTAAISAGLQAARAQDVLNLQR